jgi:hypothetical protein
LLPEVLSECINYTDPSVEFLEGLGDEITNYPFDPSMVSIKEQLGSTVVFSITQKVMEITDISAGFLAVHYQASEETHDCVANSGNAASIGKTFTYTAVCEHGHASVSIYLRNDGTTADECDTCSAPVAGEADFVAYYLSIPCEPACVPAEPECYGGIMAMKKDTNGDAMCNYEHQPFTIEDYGDASVSFSFRNNWSCSMTDITLFLDRGAGPDCLSLNGLASGAKYANILEAVCDPVTKTALVEVYVSSTSIAYTGAAAQCQRPSSGACSFVYKIPCSETILCGASRRLVGEGKEDGPRALPAPTAALGEIDSEQGFMTDEMKAASRDGDDSDDPEDVPYCVHEDFPCEGDEENMVHVCHYSTRAGYQTFCIPETDSDIMRFYSNDYCGPCEGWNGVTQAGQAI